WASHTSIIARSVNIPAVVGVRDVTGRVRSGETIIIDGTTGTIIVNPLPETLRFYVELRERQQEQQLHYIEERDLPPVTRDAREHRAHRGDRDAAAFQRRRRGTLPLGVSLFASGYGLADRGRTIRGLQIPGRHLRRARRGHPHLRSGRRQTTSGGIQT